MTDDMLPWGHLPNDLSITGYDLEVKWHVFNCKDPFCPFCEKLEVELPF